MELNRLLEIAAERAVCDLCADCGVDACIACHKVKGVTAAELREYHSAVYAALRRTAEDDKAREEGRLVELPYKFLFVVGPCDCSKCKKSKGKDMVCEELDSLYDGKHPKYAKDQDWEFMKDNCSKGIGTILPTERLIELAKSGEAVDGGALRYFFTQEEAEAALGGGEGG